HVLRPYQVQRLTGFTHSEADPSGATYNITQSKVAVGAGGFKGRGVAGATQTNFDYLPEHATDFVFASLAEERGFVGAAILLCLYLLVVWRALRVITVARDLFSSIVAGGIVVALLFQIFVNVGMIRVVNRQHLRLRLGRVAESLGQHAGDRAVQLAAATLQERSIGRVLDERVLEDVGRLRGKPTRVEQLRVGQPHQRRLKFGLGERRDRV